MSALVIERAAIHTGNFCPRCDWALANEPGASFVVCAGCQCRVQLVDLGAELLNLTTRVAELESIDRQLHNVAGMMGDLAVRLDLLRSALTGRPRRLADL